MQSTDGYSLDFVSPGGSSSPYTIYFVKMANYLSTTPTAASVYTSNSVDLAFNIFGYYNSTAQTLGTIGGTTASSISLGMGGTSPINAIEYIATSSALSAASSSFVSSTYDWALIFDAIQGTAGSTTTTTSTSSTSSSEAYNFSIVLSPGSGTVVAGGGTQTSVSVVLKSGSPHPVGLSTKNLPVGVSVTFTPVSGTASFVSVLAINAPRTLALGTYLFSVVGKTGTLSRTASFTLTVLGAQANVQTVGVKLSTSPPLGGTTDPVAGSYTYQANRLLTITAQPLSGWSLDHRLVNGNPAGNGTQLSFVPEENVTIVAVFSNAAPQATQTASVSFAAAGATSSDVVVDGVSYPLPTSFAWQVGSSHQVSAQTLIPSGGATELVLAGWHGGVNSSSSALSFTVKKGMTLIANYHSKYLVDFGFIDSSGSSVAPQNATIYGPEGLVTVTSANSSAWLEAGATYTPLGGTVGGVVVPVLPGFGGFTANSPTTVTVPLSAYPVSIRIVDLFGQPISGANVTLTTSGQARLTQITGKNGSATFGDVPMGWFDATYSYLGVSGSISSSVVGVHTETVTMALSYPIFTVAAVFAGMVAISSVVRWRRNRESDRTFDGYSNDF
jgi:hypothetical protein